MDRCFPSRFPPRRAAGMAYGRGWIALGDLPGRVFLVREMDGALFSFPLAGDAEGNSRVAVLTSVDGGELWLFDFERRVLDRYAWPEGRWGSVAVGLHSPLRLELPHDLPRGIELLHHAVLRHQGVAVG